MKTLKMTVILFGNDSPTVFHTVGMKTLKMRILV